MKLSRIKSFATALTLLATLAGVQAKPAQAMILVAGGNDFLGDSWGLVDDPVPIFTCVLFLPICLLDNPKAGTAGISRQDLLDNGVSPKLADHYFEQVDQLARQARAKRLRLVTDKKDTAESLAHDIRAINPDASRRFVNFYVKQILPR